MSNYGFWLFALPVDMLHHCNVKIVIILWLLILIEIYKNWRNCKFGLVLFTNVIARWCLPIWLFQVWTWIIDVYDIYHSTGRFILYLDQTANKRTTKNDFHQVFDLWQHHPLLEFSVIKQSATFQPRLFSIFRTSLTCPILTPDWEMLLNLQQLLSPFHNKSFPNIFVTVSPRSRHFLLTSSYRLPYSNIHLAQCEGACYVFFWKREWLSLFAELSNPVSVNPWWLHFWTNLASHRRFCFFLFYRAAAAHPIWVLSCVGW